MRLVRGLLVLLLTVPLLGLSSFTNAGPSTAVPSPSLSFSLAPATPSIATCFPAAQAQVTVIPNPDTDSLTLKAQGLPQFTAFDLYLTALPHAPFGVAWPLSTLHTDGAGTATVQVDTTLIEASAVVSGTVTASHLVLFFDNAADAINCLGPGGAQVTPYNNSQHAGPAILATVGYPDASGPLQALPSLTRPAQGFNTPTFGKSPAGTTVTFVTSCSDPLGWAAIRYIDFRLVQGGVVRFWARLDRPAKKLYLYDSATNKWIGGQSPGSSGLLVSPLIRMIVSDSVVIGTLGTSGKVKWTVTFTPSARGLTFQQGVQVTDLRYQSTGWTPTGTWSVQ